MEGPALEWYRWVKANNLFANWLDFLDKVKKRFVPSQFEDLIPRETLQAGANVLFYEIFGTT